MKWIDLTSWHAGVLDRYFISIVKNIVFSLIKCTIVQLHMYLQEENYLYFISYLHKCHCMSGEKWKVRHVNVTYQSQMFDWVIPKLLKWFQIVWKIKYSKFKLHLFEWAKLKMSCIIISDMIQQQKSSDLSHWQFQKDMNYHCLF